jgi:regulator of sigma E protease
MDILIMTAQLLLGLSILVGLHEFGHLITAKIFGMRVEKYSIGFPPKIFGFQYGETEYMFGAIPLGGFVKISGMIDESMDTEQMKSEPQSWEFRAKPAWQRLIVMLGGIIVNVITGVLVFIMLLYFGGKTYYSTQEVNKHGIQVNTLGKAIGLENGDKIVKINGKEFTNFNDVFNPKLILDANSSYTVIRNGAEVNIPLPNDYITKLSESKDERPFEPSYPFQIKNIMSNSPASKAGLLKGDKILAINGKPIQYFQDLKKELASLKNKQAVITVERNGTTQNLNTIVTAEGRIGLEPEILLKADKIQYSFIEAMPLGTAEAFGIITMQIKGFGKIFSGDIPANKAISGPFKMAEMYGDTFDWTHFWRLTGLLSMVLAFMNFLPIPALDGGHVMFLTYEMIAGRAPSEKFLENAQKVGMVILLGLMVFAFGNDIYNMDWVQKLLK